MSTSALLTAAQEDTEEIRNWADHQDIELMHYPLEHYLSLDQDKHEDIFGRISEFENIVYGNRRNTLFFISQVQKYEVLDAVKECINLTLDEATARLLEENGIPAICTPGESKPIDLVEFMLRLRRFGTTLYPCGTHTKDEIPGFLEELDIPVNELEVYSLEGPAEEALKSYREQLSAHPPDIIIFHSRRAVNRTEAAFPELTFSDCKIVSGDKGVSEKLKQSGIAIDAEAQGSWTSIVSIIEEMAGL